MERRLGIEPSWGGSAAVLTLSAYAESQSPDLRMKHRRRSSNGSHVASMGGGHHQKNTRTTNCRAQALIASRLAPPKKTCINLLQQNGRTLQGETWIPTT